MRICATATIQHLVSTVRGRSRIERRRAGARVLGATEAQAVSVPASCRSKFANIKRRTLAMPHLRRIHFGVWMLLILSPVLVYGQGGSGEGFVQALAINKVESGTLYA